MGATVGATLVNGGHPVRWLEQGRSPATRARAGQAGLEPRPALDALLEDARAVVSVCPPSAALEVAQRVADAGFTGLYVDANAVSPQTARRIAELFGERMVDGGIIGPPATGPGTTRLYLSGASAAEVAGWFSEGPLTALAVEGPAGAASALKMCYAAYTKGSTALLLAVRALAEAESVTPALLAEWSISQPGLAERAEGAARGSAPKAWRFVAEMHEIAHTFDACGLPDGFHRAAAAVYERLAPLKDTDADLAAAIQRLNGSSRP